MPLLPVLNEFVLVLFFVPVFEKHAILAILGYPRPLQLLIVQYHNKYHV